MGQLLQTGLGFLVVLSAYGGLAQTKTGTQSLSICDIRSQSKKYLGQVVTVTGDVQRTGHGVGMSSPECGGAALVESNGMQKSNSPEAQLFREGTWQTFLCTDDHVFVATVRGRFGTALMRGIPGYRIVIEKVLRAEFTQQISKHCLNWDVPPPDVRIPSQAMPDLFH